MPFCIFGNLILQTSKFLIYKFPSGVSQPHKVEFLTRAAFMHRADQGHDALMHYVVFTGLLERWSCINAGDNSPLN